MPKAANGVSRCAAGKRKARNRFIQAEQAISAKHRLTGNGNFKP